MRKSVSRSDSGPESPQSLTEIESVLQLSSRHRWIYGIVKSAHVIDREERAGTIPTFPSNFSIKSNKAHLQIQVQVA